MASITHIKGQGVNIPAYLYDSYNYNINEVKQLVKQFPTYEDITADALRWYGVEELNDILSATKKRDLRPQQKIKVL